jgi:hypothetical protein
MREELKASSGPPPPARSSGSETEM